MVDIDKVVAAYTGYVTDMQALGREPYQFELDLLTAIEQLQNMHRKTKNSARVNLVVAKQWQAANAKLQGRVAELEGALTEIQKHHAYGPHQGRAVHRPTSIICAEALSPKDGD